MKTVNVFYVDESPYHNNKAVIRLNHDKFFCTSTNGSFHLIESRLMCLSHANYLRMCRDELGAELFGKNTKYPIALFSNKILANQLVKLLNARATQVLQEREFGADARKKARAIAKADKKHKELIEKHESYNDRPIEAI